MKTRLSQICIAITMFLSVSTANAQQFGGPGGGIGGQSAFQAVQGDLLQPGLPGRLWFETNYADRGLGYNGSYLSLGGKTRLFQDRLDGRWLLEGQLNQSIEDDGGFFTSVGIERVFSIKPANADVSVGGFYTYDGDDQQSFSDGFNQLGISTSIKSRRVDLLANGYFPINTKAFTVGDPTGQQIFFGNNIALQAGIENALQGFDVTLRTRPKQLAFANGFVDFGGYHYNSENDLVDNFAGARLRVGVQLINSLRLTATVNQDERFDTTGVLSASWTFGNTNSGYGSEYAGLARDLERTERNDHIVRFSQDLIVAVNPLTGQPFNVIHANNLATAPGDGTIENPFATLAAAEAASAANDVILVDFGDGTDTGYQTGIALQDNQQLLSGGGTQFLQEAGGTLIALPDNGVGATISNAGGNEVVELADNNIIGGINIDATDSNFGVFGDAIDTVTISDTTISGALKDGVKLANVAGNVAFNRNTITDNTSSGIFVNGSTDPTSAFTFADNVVDGNLLDGIQIANFEASSISLTDNSTSSNGRHGLFINNDLNSDGTGTDIDIFTHLADGNGGNGILITEGSGRLQVLDAIATNNGTAGLRIVNFTNPLEGDFTLISTADEDNITQFSNNVFGIDIELIGDDLTQNVLLSRAQVDNNSRGVSGVTNGLGTTLNLDIIDNISISNNEFEGISLIASGGSVINNQIVNNDPDNPLILFNNNILAGGGISYSLSGDTGDPITEITSIVRNVDIDSAVTGNVPGINAVGTGNSRFDLDVADSSITSAVGVAITLDNDDNGALNQLAFDSVAIEADGGILLATGDGTNTDFSITRSTIASNGILPGAGETLDRNAPGAFGPFTDTLGQDGILISTFGSGLAANGSGLSDNLTRVNIANNEINNFTFDAINITTQGTAQLLANIESNQIERNGPGLNDDPGNDDTFPGIPPGTDATPNPTEEFFFSGIEINALDVSVVTGRITNNSLVDNFERAIQLNTTFFDRAGLVNGTAGSAFTDQGTINVLIEDNRLASNIGVDATNSILPAQGANRLLGQIGVLNGVNGNINASFGANLFEDTFFAIDVNNFGPAGNVQLGFDGATNGFVGSDVLFSNFFSIGTFTEVPFSTAVGIIEAQEAAVDASGAFGTADAH